MDTEEDINGGPTAKAAGEKESELGRGSEPVKEEVGMATKSSAEEGKEEGGTKRNDDADDKVSENKGTVEEEEEKGKGPEVRDNKDGRPQERDTENRDGGEKEKVGKEQNGKDESREATSEKKSGGGGAVGDEERTDEAYGKDPDLEKKPSTKKEVENAAGGEPKAGGGGGENKTGVKGDVSRDTEKKPGDDGTADDEDGEGGDKEDDVRDTGETPGEPLSKSRMKKLQKQKENRERREMRKLEKRKEKEAAAEGSRKAAEAAASRLTPEERAAAEERAREVQRSRQLVQEQRLATWQKALEGSPRVIIDLDFESFMAERELSSLQQQVMHSYGLNSRSEKPCRLTLTGCRGKVLSNMERISGFDKWRIERHRESYMDVFSAEKSSLVYLTSDAEEEISSLVPSKSYIIGGIVDHNRHKNLTLKKAKEQGISVARLPTSCFPLVITSKVLTVNQVFEVLLKFWATHNWSLALDEVVPGRKKNTKGSEEDAAGGEKKRHKASAH